MSAKRLFPNFSFLDAPFNAKYYNGFYTIVLGEGKGKSLEGKLQVSYCTSSKEIKKKSWLIKMFS